MELKFTKNKKPSLEPKSGVEWADTMLLNPAIIGDNSNNDIHMIFRSTGPYANKKLYNDSCAPYPIFLGYAVSHDNGITWIPDFSKPALAPKLEYEIDKMYIKNFEGKYVVNYSNGCIEDPRLFYVENELYMTAACRMFPPGPYWEASDETPGQYAYSNMPKWARDKDNPFGTPAYENMTITILYKVDLECLKCGDYANAFNYICPLTTDNVVDNRDVFLFPKKMIINNKMQYVMINRPYKPKMLDKNCVFDKPCIFLSAAENFFDFITDKAIHQALIGGIFDWESEKIGSSFPPIDLGNGEWLMSNHGKSWPGYGYSQSFTILEEKENSFPVVKHRCSERLLIPDEDWEMPKKFPCPCVFSTGGIVRNNQLIISYGAADQFVGICSIELDKLVEYLRHFNDKGEK